MFTKLFFTKVLQNKDFLLHKVDVFKTMHLVMLMLMLSVSRPSICCKLVLLIIIPKMVLSHAALHGVWFSHMQHCMVCCVFCLPRTVKQLSYVLCLLALFHITIASCFYHVCLLLFICLLMLHFLTTLFGPHMNGCGSEASGFGI